MIMDKTIFAQELLDNLTGCILPYWMQRMTDPDGGFYGRRDGDDRLDPEAPKGAILNARILWTFSSAARVLGNQEYAGMASRAYAYIMERFIDREFGGTYWSLDAKGEPLDTKKQFYAIGFMIYGLTEYYRLTGDNDALGTAIELFDVIEKHSRDRVKGGYIEATRRDWTPIEDMRLSEHDANASKTMNTHLHIIEGYTNLLRALKEKAPGHPRIADVEEATRYLLRLFLDRIENQRTHHLTLFFDDDWRELPGAESYGHDIEASWLLLETAQVIGDEGLTTETLRHARHIAGAGLQGRCHDGSMVYERHPAGNYDNDKHWWVQAENVIGQLYLARFHGESGYEDKAYETWRYIADKLVDPEEGEWYWSRRADGSVNRTDDKAGFWKCPYHNSRMCLEAMHVLGE